MRFSWHRRRCAPPPPVDEPPSPAPRERQKQPTGRAILCEVEKGRATRQRILESGLAIMSEAGLGAVTFGGLAERVGMSKSGLFAHFESKDEVQLELLDHTVELAGAFIVGPAMQEPEGLPGSMRWRADGSAGRSGRDCPVAVRSRPGFSSSTTSPAPCAIGSSSSKQAGGPCSGASWSPPSVSGSSVATSIRTSSSGSCPASTSHTTSPSGSPGRTMPTGAPSPRTRRSSHARSRSSADPQKEKDMTERPLEVGMLLYPGLTMLDLVGPQTVFAFHGNTHLLWKTLDPVRSDSGVGMVPTTSLADCPNPLDILFVPGGAGTGAMMRDAEILAFLREAAVTATAVTSVCSGSLILGAAGLLDGYEATSHWAVVDRLADFGATPRQGPRRHRPQSLHRRRRHGGHRLRADVARPAAGRARRHDHPAAHGVRPHAAVRFRHAGERPSPTSCRRPSERSRRWSGPTTAASPLPMRRHDAVPTPRRVDSSAPWPDSVRPLEDGGQVSGRGCDTGQRISGAAIASAVAHRAMDHLTAAMITAPRSACRRPRTAIGASTSGEPTLGTDEDADEERRSDALAEPVDIRGRTTTTRRQCGERERRGDLGAQHLHRHDRRSGSATRRADDVRFQCANPRPTFGPPDDEQDVAAGPAAVIGHCRR